MYKSCAMLMLCALLTQSQHLALAQDAAPSPKTEPAKITIAMKICHSTEQSFPWIIKNGKGMNIIFLEMIAAKSGAKLELVGMPWEKCLAAVESGEVAGLVGASYKDDRAKYSVYPMINGKLDAARRMRTDGYTLYRLKNNPISWNGSKFEHLTGQIGAQHGYSIVSDLKKWGAQVDDSVMSAEGLMQKLVAGKLQGAAMLSYDGELQMESNPEFAAKVEGIAPVLIDKPYFMIFGKAFYAKNQDAAEAFWNWTPIVRQSADYRAKLFAISAARKQ